MLYRLQYSKYKFVQFLSNIVFTLLLQERSKKTNIHISIPWFVRVEIEVNYTAYLLDGFIFSRAAIRYKQVQIQEQAPPYINPVRNISVSV